MTLPAYQTDILPPAREQVLVNSCLDYINRIGHFAWRQNQGAVQAEYKGRKRFVRFSGVDGISDIIGVLRPSGRMLAVEVKVKPNKPSEKQKQFLALVEARGGLAILVYSIEELIEAIEGK